jgi:hypothetical protein
VSGDETAEVEVAPSGEHEEPSPAPVLVVQKIGTLTIGSRLVLAFSAVGYVFASIPRSNAHNSKRTLLSATALFWLALQQDPVAVPEGLLVVHAHDFGRPVVIFAPVDGSTDCIGCL